MIIEENTLIVLLIILAVGLIIPELFKRLKIPFVTSLILVGAILGPHGVNYIESNQVIEFFGFLGMSFLMFMTGFETDTERLKKLKYKVAVMAGLNGFIPFATGVAIMRFFGYPWLVSILIGVIFISSSIAIVVPSLKSAGLFKKDVGKIILSSVLIADMVSLVALSFILQGISPITHLPLPLYFLFLALSVAALFFIVPRLTNYLFQKNIFARGTDYEQQLRFVILIVIAVLAYFSTLGVHPILAAFIVGLTLSHIVKHKIIYTKLHTLGYGLFVPVFFFIVGMEMDIGILREFDATNILMLAIILGLILSKFVSGYIGGRLVKLSWQDSSVFGVASMVQLTTTLAVAYAASSLDILDSRLTTTIILLSVITTVFAPLILKLMAGMSGTSLKLPKE